MVAVTRRARAAGFGIAWSFCNQLNTNAGNSTVTVVKPAAKLPMSWSPQTRQRLFDLNTSHSRLCYADQRHECVPGQSRTTFSNDGSIGKVSLITTKSERQQTLYLSTHDLTRRYVALLSDTICVVRRKEHYAIK